MSSHFSALRPQWQRTVIQGAVVLAVANIAMVSTAHAGAGCDYSAASGSVTIASDTYNCVVGGTAALTINAGVYIGADGSDAAVKYRDDLAGSLNNLGTVSIGGAGDLRNGVAGVRIGNELLGTLSNSGEISASDNSESAFRTNAFGIYEGSISREMQGMLTNSGLISANATNSMGEGVAVAQGIFIRNRISEDAVIDNSGTIRATATAEHGYASATGIESNTLDGLIINSGTISALAADRSYALDISSGSGHVDNSGTLRGGLNLGGTISLNNSGVLDLRPLSGSGSNLIGGDFTQTGSGVLRIGASGAGEGGYDYDQLIVGGTATVAGKADVDVASVNTLAAGNTLTGVVRAASVSGNFSSVTDNSALFDFRSVVSHGLGQDRIDLVIVQGLTAVQATTASNNHPAVGAAAVFDRLVDQGESSGDMQTVITALGQLSTERSLSGAVSQTLPLLTAGTAQATSAALHASNRVLQARQDSLSGRAGGDSFYSDRKVWVKPFTSIADQDDRGGVSGYGAKTYGVVIGADADVGRNRLGVAFAYSGSAVNSNAGNTSQHADINSYQLIGYGSRNLDANTELSMQADIGLHQTSGERQINFGGLNRVAKSDYDSWSAHLGAGVARTMVLSERASFTPSLRADYTVIRDDGYGETGADALNLNVGRNRAEEMIVSLDGKLSYALSDRTTLVGNIGGGYDLMSKQASINAAFAGSPSASFTTKGLDPSPWLARAGLGVVKKISDKTELSARYDVELRQGFVNQTASVKARWMF